MTIDPDDLEHVAQLAALDVDEDQLEQFAEDLGDIVDYVDKLDELETDDVEPTAHPTAAAHEPAGDDATEEPLDSDALTDQAPDGEDGLFRVPRVVDS